MLYRPLDKTIKNWRDFDKKYPKDWQRAGIDPRWSKYKNNKEDK